MRIEVFSKEIHNIFDKNFLVLSDFLKKILSNIEKIDNKDKNFYFFKSKISNIIKIFEDKSINLTKPNFDKLNKNHNISFTCDDISNLENIVKSFYAEKKSLDNIKNLEESISEIKSLLGESKISQDKDVIQEYLKEKKEKEELLNILKSLESIISNISEYREKYNSELEKLTENVSNTSSNILKNNDLVKIEKKEKIPTLVIESEKIDIKKELDKNIEEKEIKKVFNSKNIDEIQKFYNDVKNTEKSGEFSVFLKTNFHLLSSITRLNIISFLVKDSIGDRNKLELIKNELFSQVKPNFNNDSEYKLWEKIDKLFNENNSQVKLNKQDLDEKKYIENPLDNIKKDIKDNIVNCYSEKNYRIMIKYIIDNYIIGYDIHKDKQVLELFDDISFEDLEKIFSIIIASIILKKDKYFNVFKLFLKIAIRTKNEKIIYANFSKFNFLKKKKIVDVFISKEIDFVNNEEIFTKINEFIDKLRLNNDKNKFELELISKFDEYVTLNKSINNSDLDKLEIEKKNIEITKLEEIEEENTDLIKEEVKIEENIKIIKEENIENPNEEELIDEKLVNISEISEKIEENNIFISNYFLKKIPSDKFITSYISYKVIDKDKDLQIIKDKLESFFNSFKEYSEIKDFYSFEKIYNQISKETFEKDGKNNIDNICINLLYRLYKLNRLEFREKFKRKFNIENSNEELNYEILAGHFVSLNKNIFIRNNLMSFDNYIYRNLTQKNRTSDNSIDWKKIVDNILDLIKNRESSEKYEEVKEKFNGFFENKNTKTNGDIKDDIYDKIIIKYTIYSKVINIIKELDFKYFIKSNVQTYGLWNDLSKLFPSSISNSRSIIHNELNTFIENISDIDNLTKLKLKYSIKPLIIDDRTDLKLFKNNYKNGLEEFLSSNGIEKEINLIQSLPEKIGVNSIDFIEKSIKHILNLINYFNKDVKSFDKIVELYKGNPNEAIEYFEGYKEIFNTYSKSFDFSFSLNILNDYISQVKGDSEIMNYLELNEKYKILDEKSDLEKSTNSIIEEEKIEEKTEEKTSIIIENEIKKSVGNVFLEVNSDLAEQISEEKIEEKTEIEKLIKLGNFDAIYHYIIYKNILGENIGIYKNDIELFLLKMPLEEKEKFMKKIIEIYELIIGNNGE